MPTQENDVEAAERKAREAAVKAGEASQEAKDAKRSPEEKKAAEAVAKADEARAKAQELAQIEADKGKVPTTASEAGVLAMLEPDILAGDHAAQKKGNDPANPQMAPGIDENGPKVKLSRKTPDVPGGLVYAEVPKEMAGDYERAGWNRE